MSTQNIIIINFIFVFIIFSSMMKKYSGSITIQGWHWIVCWGWCYDRSCKHIWCGLKRMWLLEKTLYVYGPCWYENCAGMW